MRHEGVRRPPFLQLRSVQSRRLEDRISELSARLIQADEENHKLIALELQAALSQHAERARNEVLRSALFKERRRSQPLETEASA